MRSDDELKRFWALEIVSGFFPQFDRWLRGLANRDRFMTEAETELEKSDAWAIEKACRTILKDGEMVPHTRLPFVIAREAIEISSRAKTVRLNAVAGTSTVACLICGDTGFVEILHPESVAHVMRTGTMPVFPYLCSVFCPCEIGREKALSMERGGRKAVMFDAKRHIKRDVTILPREQYEMLVEQLRESVG